MKKLIAVLLAVSLVLTLGAGVALADKPQKAIDQGNGLPSGEHFNLNLIGKKADWNGGGGYDNPDRHTMFVPVDTTGWTIPTPGDDSTTNVGDLDGIKISMTQGADWAVIDGNAFDDGECAFQLAPGTYHVYIVAKAKPGGYTDVTGWVYAEDEYGAAYYYDIGDIRVTKSKKWKDATGLFYVSPWEDYFGIVTGDTWVFTYLDMLKAYDFGDDPDITDAAYFWQYDNHGNKLVKVRFYKD